MLSKPLSTLIPSPKRRQCDHHRLYLAPFSVERFAAPHPVRPRAHASRSQAFTTTLAYHGLRTPATDELCTTLSSSLQADLFAFNCLPEHTSHLARWKCCCDRPLWLGAGSWLALFLNVQCKSMLVISDSTVDRRLLVVIMFLFTHNYHQ